MAAHPLLFSKQRAESSCGHGMAAHGLFVSKQPTHPLQAARTAPILLAGPECPMLACHRLGDPIDRAPLRFGHRAFQTSVHHERIYTFPDWTPRREVLRRG